MCSASCTSPTFRRNFATQTPESRGPAWVGSGRATASTGSSILEPRSFGSVWRFASQEVPRIARQLSYPKFPTTWKIEAPGKFGISEVLAPHRKEIQRLLRKHGVGRLWVYGSVARGEADDRSDVDLLVEWLGRRRWDRAPRLASDLEGLLDRRVQVRPRREIYWAVRDRILSEAIEFRWP